MSDCPDEVRAILARHDERIKALATQMENNSRDRDRAIRLASDELTRRLDNLNHAHSQAREVISTYLPRETHDRDISHLDVRLRKAEDSLRDLIGRLWLPMLAAAGIAAGLAAAVVKMLVK